MRALLLTGALLVGFFCGCQTSREVGVPAEIDASGQWYSEQKSREMHKTYLQSLREMEESVASATSNDEALALAEWRLTYGRYDETYMKDILLLAEGKRYDFLQLAWWRSESSERRLCILMCFYHRLNPELSNFPSFRLYSRRFEGKECESRLKEIEFVEALRESRRLEGVVTRDSKQKGAL